MNVKVVIILCSSIFVGRRMVFSIALTTGRSQGRVNYRAQHRKTGMDASLHGKKEGRINV